MADVRHIAPALKRGDVVALGAFETTVHICRLNPFHDDLALETVLSFGGDRLALCTPGESLVVVAAAWERHGVCGYDATTGERLWQRKDLKRAGPLSPAGDGSLVAVALDRGAMQVLEASTGESVARIRAADRLRQSPHGTFAVTGRYRQIALLDTSDWSRRWVTPINGFAMLDAAFAPDGFIVSGAEGHVAAFDLDGRPQWSHRLPDERACWALGWDEAANEWVGLVHDINQKALDFVARWARDGGQSAELPLASVAAAAFIPGGRTLVTDTQLVDTQTGTTRQLAVS